MMKRLGSVLGMSFAGLALLLPGLVFDSVAADTIGGLQETTVRYGPFVLPPAGQGGDVDHANVFLPNVPKPCEDCFIVRAEPDLVYEDGTPANLDTGLMLHHALLFNNGRPDTTCGKDTFFGRFGERFLASGNERTTKHFPDGYGYHLGRDPVTGVFHIMNHSAETKTVSFTFKVTLAARPRPPGMRPVTPVWVDMNNCRTSEYAVPAGPSSEHWTWKSTITGRIVSAGGHVHTGGVRTTLTNATTRQHVCTSWAGYGQKPAYMGTIESMSYCRVGRPRRGPGRRHPRPRDGLRLGRGRPRRHGHHDAPRLRDRRPRPNSAPAPAEVSGAQRPPSATPPRRRRLPPRPPLSRSRKHGAAVSGTMSPRSGEGGRDVGFGGGLVDAQPGQPAVVVFEFEERQEDVLRAYVVVAEAQRSRNVSSRALRESAG